MLSNNHIQERKLDQTCRFIEHHTELCDSQTVNDTKSNQKNSTEVISKRKSRHVHDADKQENRLLHVLANVPNGNAHDTIETIAKILNKEIREFVPSRTSQDTHLFV